ncbi:glucose repression protein [Yamadazyma tenuis]|uniref:Glucose-signaling factor 2 n=1 Tax=Candida tenuis (strain ATCC 10573 / BCRC 21748 / CBS 615 / JCM 9827 / NBRC 10315 / NRRL Y-1498 / VKM Y-70) TaxID=590646 RepID=G3BF90_CANTC|nr:uncharacterized protein CANTEDRAFT_126748 [Yamadazyma tenuis ATCC 10573]EGV60001.1 hypothetical protein CANTEDRAFT_126748 [Yamadazyma tenuis ATCC 10573]WEJ94773.1 glucose repression protein [Yamadazyma tenuis]
MSDEKNIVDAAQEAEEGFLECYIRFNDDAEKDYCFQVSVNTQFNDLFRIFSTLPISLRPSIFYSQKPAGFKISTAPGYLTDDGAILFDHDATSEKYLQTIDLSDKIGDKIWPGQLIVPVWERNTFGYYAFVTGLLVWLYTDLPDFVSPTPGICLTNQMSKFVCWVLTKLGKPDLGKVFIEDLYDETGIAPQMVFFCMHLIKVSIIYLLVNLGIFNPIKLFKIPGTKGIKKDVTRDELLHLGWTGSKRSTIEEYREYYRNFRIKQYKSIVEAQQDGLFTRLRVLGVQLKDGEGYNTPLDKKSTLKDLLNKDDIKFTLNYAYLAKLSNLFEKHIGEPEVDINEAVKQFRRYGLCKRDSVIEEIVELRKSVEVKET